MEPYVNLSPERTAFAGTPGCPQEMADKGKSTTLWDVVMAQKKSVITFKYKVGSTNYMLLSGFQVLHRISFVVARGDLLVICKIKHKTPYKTNLSSLAFL